MITLKLTLEQAENIRLALFHHVVVGKALTNLPTLYALVNQAIDEETRTSNILRTTTDIDPFWADWDDSYDAHTRPEDKQ